MRSPEESTRRHPTRREVLALGVGAFVVAAVPLARHRRQVVRRSVPVMGTVADLLVVHSDERYAHRALDAAVAELEWVHRSMTRYDENSEVGRANALAGSRPAAVSMATAAVVKEGLRWAEGSHGRFDPALGRVSELWDVSDRTRPPGHGAWGRFAGAGMYRSVEVGSENGRPAIFLEDAGVSLDLGGIAKGYGVDRAVEVLREWGIGSGLVNAGGDLYALGSSPDGDDWKVGIRDPDDVEGTIAEVAVRDAAVATSGDYQRYFEHGARRYHHLLDPDTGAPRVTGERSLTVEAGTCMVADAAATTAFGMPDAERDALLRNMGSVARVVHRV